MARPRTCSECSFRDTHDGMCWHPDARWYPLRLSDPAGQCKPPERCPLPLDTSPDTERDAP